MIRSFFVPFVHSLHIEISLNLSVFLRDSLSENTSFTSFTVTTVKDVPHLWIRHNNREQAHTSADCANRYSPAFLLHANVPNAFGRSTCQTTHFLKITAGHHLMFGKIFFQQHINLHL